MPIIATSLCGCVPLQSTLDNYWSLQNTPGGRDTGSTSFLQFLQSTENNRNRSRLSESIATSAGKKRPVTMLYDSPVCVSVCLKTGGCASVPTPTNAKTNCITFDVQEQWTTCDGGGLDTALNFDRATFKNFCEREDGAYMQRQFAMYDMQFFKGLDKSMVTMLQGISAAQPAANIIPAFPILTAPSSTGWQSINPIFFQYIDELFQDAGMAGTEYVILGGKMVSRITGILKVASASQEGFDVNNLANGMPKMFYDRNFDAIYGSNAVVVLPLGALQLVNYVDNQGEKSFEDERLIQKFKTMNLGNGTDLAFDYKWKYDPECGIYSYQPYTYMELVKSVCGGCGVDTDQCGIFTITNCTALNITC